MSPKRSSLLQAAVSFLAMAVLMTPTDLPGADTLAGLLPAEAGGWRTEGPDGLYSPETLYDLIDGGAEVYLALNVGAVLSRRYHREGHPPIIADIFDMGSAADAFGAYRHDMREGEDAGIGRESEIIGGTLYFWKDRYFVSIIPLGDSTDIRAAVLDMGRATAGKITKEGEIPEIVSHLPEKGLKKEQVHYFHDWTLLSTHIDLGEENLLGLDRGTEGVLARYDHEGTGSLTLLLVNYTSPDEAAGSLAEFLEGYLPGTGADGLGKTVKDLWAGARARGKILFAVLGAPDRETAGKMLDDVNQVMKR
jgi:hypothetical protein